MPRPAPQRVAHALLALGAVLLAAFTARAAAPGALPWLPSTAVYDAVDVLGTLAIVLRAATVREDRTAWALIAVAVCASTLGDVLSTIIYASGDLPVPSWCEPLWLGFYPPFVVAAGLLTRGRVHGLRSGMWLDGAAGALAVAAVMSATLVAPLLRQVAGQPLPALLTNVAYPVGDLVVVAALVATTAVGGWRLDRRWVLLLAGTLAFVAADCAYLVQTAAGTYVDGGIRTWAGSAPRWSSALPPGRPQRTVTDRRAAERGVVLAPVVFAALALVVVLQQALAHAETVTLVFAGATLAVVVGRLTAVHADHQRLLRESRLDAATDELTGLWNRRRLMADLEATARGRHGARGSLLLFDLDGFKSYNDTFGHPAGDALLRAPRRAASRGRPRGRAYRLGGDEFCVLVDRAPGEDPIVAARRGRADRARATASRSAPRSARCAARRGDRRRRRRCGSPTGACTRQARPRLGARQTRDVLLRSLAERDARLGAHVDGRRRLAAAVGRRLGLEPASCASSPRRRAARRRQGRDPGRDPRQARAARRDEWALVRQHTSSASASSRRAGARPSPASCAQATSAGTARGYPDGLGGDEIPLGRADRRSSATRSTR